METEVAAKFDIVDAHNDRWSNAGERKRLTFIRKPLFDNDSKFFVVGPCFADRLRGQLMKRNKDVYPKYDLSRTNAYPQHFNSFTMRREIERGIREEYTGKDEFLCLSRMGCDYKGGKVWQDPYRRGIYGYGRAQCVENSRTFSDKIFEGLKKADVFIFTMGLAEVWFRDDTGEGLNQRPGRKNQYPEKGFSFKRTSVRQNVENMKAICSLISERHPGKPIFITVSPTAFNLTYSGNDVIVANTESKSTLRAAAAEVERAFENVTYWPSYEMALAADSWMADWRGPRHEVSKAIIETFFKVHGTA